MVRVAPSGKGKTPVVRPADPQAVCELNRNVPCIVPVYTVPDPPRHASGECDVGVNLRLMVPKGRISFPVETERRPRLIDGMPAVFGAVNDQMCASRYARDPGGGMLIDASPKSEPVARPI
jgi:hypothetical protein